jgi:carbon monoxide dehydrogenase subunit G
MPAITRSIAVHAPAARVFDHLSDPAGLLEIWPSMVEVSDARVEAGGAHRFDWTYRMAGVPFHGHCDTVEVEAARRRVDRNTGSIPSTFRWRFDPRGEDTEVTLEVEYAVPALLALVAGPVLRAVNEREAETLLANLKTRLETGVAPVARR